MTDKLKLMLKLQKAYQDKYGTGFSFPPELHDWASAMSAEAMELWGGCGGKWWKKKQNTPEKNLEELVDIWHFFMGYMLQAGITPEQFFEAYKKKLAENYRRQETGY